MFSASFAPMILKLVFPKLEKKMDKLKLDIIDLDEWKDVKDIIKKLKNKRIFKSLGK